MGCDGSRRTAWGAPAATGLATRMALAGVDAGVEISGPQSASADFAFTLTWSHSSETTRLKDRSNLSRHAGGWATFVKSAGTYDFDEIYCVAIPPNDFSEQGEACVWCAVACRSAASKLAWLIFDVYWFGCDYTRTAC